jgi:hypothetical protein
MHNNYITGLEDYLVSSTTSALSASVTDFRLNTTFPSKIFLVKSISKFAVVCVVRKL